MPARAHVSRDDLLAGLQMLVRMQGKKKNTGRAQWRFESDGLTISWGEAQQVIDAKVTKPGGGTIDGGIMRTLAIRLPKDEVLDVTAEGSRVKLGSILVDATGLLDVTPKLGPDASDGEVLTAAIRLTREEWRAAGIEERVDCAVARSKQAAAAAAAILTPFGIDETAILRLLSDTLRARSSTESDVIVR